MRRIIEILVAVILFGSVFIAATFFLLAAAGCASKPKVRLPADVSAIKAFETIDAGVKQVEGALSDVEAEGLTATQKVNVKTARLVLKDIATGSVSAHKAYDTVAKQADSSRQRFFRLLDLSSWVSGIALALGIGLLVMAVINGGKVGAGIGICALGGAGILTFMVMRAVSPVLVWVAAGLGVVVVAGTAWFVYDLVRGRIKLRKEELATKELTKTVEVIKPHLAESSREKLFTEIVPEIQSDSTKTLVKEAKATALKTTQAETAAALVDLHTT